MPLLPILAGVNAVVGLYNSISAGRERGKRMGAFDRLMDIQVQTAEGRGPLIESTVGSLNRAAELTAQRAGRAVPGIENRALNRTLANQARIEGMRATAGAVGQLRSQALSPGLAAVGQQGAFDALGLKQRGAAESIGTGISEIERLLEEHRRRKMFTSTVPNYEFQMGFPGGR